MSRRQELKLLAKIVNGVAATFGPYCEVVLHDLTRPDHSIVAIGNGHVTGRQPGDALPDADLYKLAAQNPNQDMIVGYRSHTADGRPLRCTTVFFRDDEGQPYAALGINYDLSLVRSLHEQTSFLLDDSRLQKDGPIASGAVRNLVRDLMEEAIRGTGKAASQLDRDDRIQVARHLEERGAFVIRGSVSTAARTLGVSRMAMYTYIEEARHLISRQAAVQGQEGETKEQAEVKPKAAAR